MEHAVLNSTVNSGPARQYRGKFEIAEAASLAPLAPMAPAIAAAGLPAKMRAGRVPTWLDLLDPRQPEAFLAFCSIWCAVQMWVWPDEFAASNALITLEIGLRGHERVWAIFGATAGLLKLVGLACRMSARWRDFSGGLIASGLFMSIIFWMIVGVSRVMDFPHTITPVALTGLGLGAAFELAQRRDPREAWK